MQFEWMLRALVDKGNCVNMSFILQCHDISTHITRSRPNWITGPAPKSGSAGKSESRGPENRVSRWRRPNSDIYSQNYHFGLVYDVTQRTHDTIITSLWRRNDVATSFWRHSDVIIALCARWGYIDFLAWKQRIISLVCFANNAIRPWPQVMPIFVQEMPPGSTPAINVYVAILPISPFWRIGETNPSAKTFKTLFSIVMPTFGKSCRRPSLHGLKNQSKVGSSSKFSKMAATGPARGLWAGSTPENLPVSDSENMFNIS